MQCDGEFDDTQIGSEMSASLRHLVHKEQADLCCEHVQVLISEVGEVSRLADPWQETHLCSVEPAPHESLRPAVGEPASAWRRQPKR